MDEVDYNHPLHADKVMKTIRDAGVTHVSIDGNDVIYIYCPLNDMTLGRNIKMLEQYAAKIKEEFSKIFPDTPIIIGYNDLQFTTISKKQAFKGKLNGQI